MFLGRRLEAVAARGILGPVTPYIIHVNRILNYTCNLENGIDISHHTDPEHCHQMTK